MINEVVKQEFFALLGELETRENILRYDQYLVGEFDGSGYGETECGCAYWTAARVLTGDAEDESTWLTADALIEPVREGRPPEDDDALSYLERYVIDVPLGATPDSNPVLHQLRAWLEEYLKESGI